MIQAMLPIAKRAVRGWRAPVRYLLVTGDSMSPTLCDGDWVLVRRADVARVGEIVVAHRPGDGLMVVKRVARVTATGYWLFGDNSKSSTDSRHFGPVPQVVGRLVWRVRPWGAVPPIPAGVRFAPTDVKGSYCAIGQTKPERPAGPKPPRDPTSG